MEIKFRQLRSITTLMKGMRRYLIGLYFFLLFGTTKGLAQEQQIYFEHLTSKDGLSESVINCILQDSRGFMWFGTNDGLNKYDGYLFTVFRPSKSDSSSISSNLVFSISEDQDSRLWIGTTGGGVNIFDLKTETFSHLKHYPDNPNSLSSNHIRCIESDRQGRVWIAQ